MPTSLRCLVSAETAAPGTQAELGALMRAWAEGGAACPAD